MFLSPRSCGHAGAYAPARRAWLLRKSELVADGGKDGVDLHSQSLHPDDASDRDQRRQERVLDQVLAIFITNETSEQIHCLLSLRGALDCTELPAQAR